MKTPERLHEHEESPPFGGSWSRIYWAVVFFTLALVMALYWMTAALND